MTQHKATVQFVLFFYMIINATPYRVSTECGSLVEGCLPDVVPSHKTNIKGARKLQPDLSLHSGPKPRWERRRVGRRAMLQPLPAKTTYATDTIDFQEQGVACSRLKHETGIRGSSKSVMIQNGHCSSGNVLWKWYYFWSFFYIMTIKSKIQNE